MRRARRKVATSDHAFVMLQAAESLTQIAQDLSLAQIEECYFPVVKRLSSGDWFTSRTVSPLLFPSLAHVAEKK